MVLLTMALTPVSMAHDVGAYNVEITHKYVMATAKCSCSLSTDYKHHTRVFYNYDPISHHYGVLAFEEGSSTWTSPEGMWYSTVTDMDFCLVHGKSHDGRGVYLVPFDGVINGYNVVDGYFTGKFKPIVRENRTVELSKKDLFLDRFRDFDFWTERFLR
jgi:hypothetical protein